MECENKEVHTHHGVFSAVFLLQVKNGEGSWYERARGTTNLVSIDMKTIFLNSLGEDILKWIEI